MPDFSTGSGTRRWWDPDKNWGDQTMDRMAGWTVQGPETVWENYGKLADQGVYGQEGINYITKGMPMEQSLARKRLLSTIKRRYGSRLGARAGGAAERMAANEVFAPLFEQEMSVKRGLRQRNLESKLEGLAGQERLNQALLAAFTQMYAGKQENETGALDYMAGFGGLLGSAADLFGKEKVAGG